MGAISRQRGVAWEREVARALTDATGLSFERNLMEPRSGNTGDITGPLPIVVQCKSGRRPDVWEAVREACEVARSRGQLAVALVERRHGRGRTNERIAAMPWHQFLRLLPRVAKFNWSDYTDGV